MNKIIGFIAVVALAVGSTGVVKEGKQGVRGLQGVQGEQGVKGDKGDRGVQGERGLQGVQGIRGATGAVGMPERLGAVSGPDISSPYLSVNGILSFYHRSGMATGTTTPCAFQSPNATSTLTSAVARFNVSSTTATTVTFGRATNSGATTTWLHNGSLAANAQGTFLVPKATTTNQIFSPKEWLVVGMSGGNGTHDPSGACQAVFEQI